MTSQIRIQLITFDDFMAACVHDIPKFNENTKFLLDLIKARGETKSELLMNIFKGYAVCSNKVFVKYVEHKQEGYEEGIDILPDNLMHLALQKFNILKTTNKWNSPSES